MAYLQVLAESEDVNAGFPHVMHGLHDFLLSLSQAKHYGRFRKHAGCLGMPQDRQALIVPDTISKINKCFKLPLNQNAHKLN